MKHAAVGVSDEAGADARIRVGELLRQVQSRVGSAREARWLISSALGLTDEQLLGSLARSVPAGARVSVEGMVERMLGGEPLQYVLGRWAFRTLELNVDSRVLVPRPETEQVVGYALEEIGEVLVRRLADTETAVAVDLGTGSGAIALSLAVEAPVRARGDLEVWATDDSTDALGLAMQNLSLLRETDTAAADRVRLCAGSWFEALPTDLAGRVHLLVSNPPYVSVHEWHRLDPVVRDHEPRHALVGGDTGREALELIVTGARRWLVPGGVLVLELAPYQAESVAATAESEGFTEVEVRADLAGLPRALVARWPGGPGWVGSG